MGASPSSEYFENARIYIEEMSSLLSLYKSADFMDQIEKKYPNAGITTIDLASMIEFMEYKSRVAFRLYQAIEYGYNRITALTTGPRCDGSPEVFSQIGCEKSGSRWVPFTTLPDKSVGENAKWLGFYNIFNEYYTKELKGTVQMMKDLSEAYDVQSVEKIEARAMAKMPAIIQRTNQLYQMILFTPTYTVDSAKAIYDEEANKRAQQEALKAAVAASKNV